MVKKMDKIKALCEALEFKAGYLTDEFLFTVVGMDYFYFGGNIGEQDILDGYVDGKGDGGIDFIHSDANTMYLVQGKSSDKLSKEDLHNIFTKMHRSVEAFNKGAYDSFNDKLKSLYINTSDSLPENHDIVLVLFTNAVVDPEMEKKFRKETEETSLRDYEIDIYDHNSIELKSIEEELEKEYVEEDSILIDDSKNMLTYSADGSDDGIIVNVKGSSLKNLYLKHKGKGLFNYNLREHISQKNVDDGIDRTIENEKDNFWYYNNGITIACDDYHVDGYKVKLFDFSIINGAQTTTKIGKSPHIRKDRDISVVCKIVRNSQMRGIESREFMNKISEASNSQKPIKGRDLKANRDEQKQMQVKAARNKPKDLSITIKRGVKPNNYYKVQDSWQRTTNERVGQLILSVIYQSPGTARSGKASIFNHEPTYNKIFRRNHDYDTLYDLVKVERYYDEFKKDFSKRTKEDDMDKVAIARNGKFVILALIGYLIKRKKGIVSSSADTEELTSDNLSGTLISNYEGDDIEERFHEMFEFMINELKNLYKIYESELQLTSYSNFFKTDQRYKRAILKGIDERFFDDKYNRRRVEEEYYDILD